MEGLVLQRNVLSSPSPSPSLSPSLVVSARGGDARIAGPRFSEECPRSRLFSSSFSRSSWLLCALGRRLHCPASHLSSVRMHSSTAAAPPIACPLPSQGDGYEKSDLGQESRESFSESSDEDDQSSDFEDTKFQDGRLRFRPDIVIEDPQYAGIKRSRKEAFDDYSSMGSEQIGEDMNANGNQAYVWDSDGADEHEFQSTEDFQRQSPDLEMEALDKEYTELQAQEEEMLRGLKGRTDEEVQKGQAVSKQKALWDKALEVRILLQKPFSTANSLPMENTQAIFCRANEEVNNAFEHLAASCISTIDSLTKITQVLMQENNYIDGISALNATNTKSTSIVSPTTESSDILDMLWQQLSLLYSRFVPFRNSSIDRWHRKTQLSSGQTVSRSKLKAFNQSISQQIENHMRDYSRMLRRMQLNRSSVDIIGMAVQSNIEQIDSFPENSATVATQDLRKGTTGGDPELIDDAEFYQELLREFLESSDPASLGAFHSLTKLQSKRRKVVDRRASKGRKIGYNVHEKIVNFMAPVPMNMPPMADKLFSNLFGQGSKM